MTDPTDTLLKAAEQTLAHDAGTELEQVSNWLGRLTLLYGVPLHYLLPAPALVPPESLRLFFLDPNWVQALLQGAFSVGDSRYGDSLIDQAMNQWLQPAPVASPVKGEKVSNAVDTPTARAASGERARLREQHEGVTPKSSGEPLRWPLNGFLLRSELVRGWRGLEIEAIDAADQKLEPLRIEQLSDDLLMVLFNGVIGTLTIRQPREGLHFGLTPDAQSGHYVKSLRNTGSGDLCQQDGNPLTVQLAPDQLLRDQPEKGVVRMAELAQRMQTELAAAGQLSDGHFGPGAFGLQLVEAAGEFNFSPESADDT